MFLLKEKNVSRNKITIILLSNIFMFSLTWIFSINLSYLIVFLILYIFTFFYYRIYSSISKFYLFSVVLPCYMLFSLIVGFDYINSIGAPYGFADEVTFYKVVFFYHPELQPTELNKFDDGFGFFNLIDWPAYFTLLNFIGELFYYIESQSFFSVKLVSVFAGLSSVLTFYSILRLYYDKNESLKMALIFGFLPIIIFQSSVLMRDVIVLLLSMLIVLSILKIKLKNDLLKNYLLLILFSSLLILFRPENGIFILFFIFSFFIYTYTRDYKVNFILKFYLISMFLLFILFFLYKYLFFVIELFQNTMSIYKSRELMSAGSNSLGITIRQIVPFPLDIFVSFLLSVISPFPFWGNVKSSYSLLLEGIGSLILIYFWAFSLFSLFYSKIRNKINKDLVLVFCFFLLYYLIVSYIQPLHRRLMLMYPFVIIFGYVSYGYLDGYLRKVIITSTTIILFCLYLVYFLLKF